MKSDTLRLLPAADQHPRCAAYSQDLAVRPAGTTQRLDRIVVASVSPPWPKPALSHPLLKPSAAAIAHSAVPSRLFAGEPWAGDTCVEVYERNGLGFESYRWTCTSSADLASLIDTIATAPLGAHGMAPVTVIVPTFLVCTQGSHDQCCGEFGTALADQVEAERPSWRVRRISHTGGHRFAPTVLALPSGRMWAWADIDLLDRVSVGVETDDDLRRRCRGWIGAPGAVAQVAELAARIDARSPFVQSPKIDIDPEPDGRATRCIVTAGDQRWYVEVTQSRTVPTVACGAAGGLPAKEAVEYQWRMVTPIKEWTWSTNSR